MQGFSLRLKLLVTPARFGNDQCDQQMLLGSEQHVEAMHEGGMPKFKHAGRNQEGRASGITFSLAALQK